MTFSSLVEAIGDGDALTISGFIIGICFGIFAQRSRFCLRSAVIETFHGKFGVKLAVWLLAFSAAIVLTQIFIIAQLLDVSTARQLATRGTLSGALIGGVIFGIGMMLSRGCASRLLILSGSGNLRSLFCVLVFAITAQASLNGILAPIRNGISNAWTIEGGSARNLLDIFHVGNTAALIFGLVWLVGGIGFALHAKMLKKFIFFGFGAGAMVACAWLVTYQISLQSFDVVPIKAISFTGPCADVLMYFLTPSEKPWTFDLTLVPGVLLGSFIASVYSREFKLEGFKDELSILRYGLGAVCLGFGGMLAGGCAVGAGVSGAAVFALTAWVTLFAIWASAGLTDYMIDRN